MALKTRFVNTKRPWTAYFLLYTAVFAIMACFVFFSFYQNKRSFVWVGSPDGLSQHYNSLMYWGEYLRAFFKNIFQNGAFVLPLWDFSIGYGADILTTLHYYVIGDPLALLSVFVPPEHTEVLYNVLVLLRIYLAGVTFSAYCRYMGKSRYSTFIASFIYIFSGFVLYASVRHPYFINPMIYLPLMLIGVEKILKKQRPYFFIIMVAVAAASNFYFFYMLTLVVMLYILFRFFQQQKENYPRDFCNTFLKFSGCYLLGFGMAMVVFLPVAMTLLGSNRVGEGPLLLAVYEWDYYKNLFAAFAGGAWQYKWTCLSFTPAALLCVIALGFQRKKNKFLMLGLGLLTLFLCFPIFGKIFNGFSYSVNRWCFAYAMLVSYIVASVLPNLEHLKKKQAGILAVTVGAYLFLSLLIPENRTADYLIPYALTALLTIAVFAAACLKANKKIIHIKGKLITRGCIVVIVLTGIVVNAYYRYAPGQGDYVSQFVPAGQANSYLTENNASAAMKTVNDTDFYRFESDVALSKYNSALQNRVNGTDYYFSLTDGNISDYMEAHRFVRVNDATYNGLSGRAYLDAVAGVKYYVAHSQQPAARPYGFDTLVKTYIAENADKTYYIYKNENALPFGYTYSHIMVMAASDFKKLSVLEKAQAQLQTAVIDEQGVASSLSIAEPEYTNKEIPFTIEFSDGVEKTEAGFRIKKKGAQIKITYQPFENSETYLLFNQLKYYKKNSGASYAKIKVLSAGREQDIRINTPYYSWYTGSHDFLLNLGFGQNGEQTITLEFSAKGEYQFEKLWLEGQPMSQLTAQTAALTEDVMRDTTFSANRVTGTITLAQSKLLCFNMPYSEGWSVFVDGEKQQLQKVNGMFCGVMLGEGSHNIELRYTTPYLKTGSILSLGAAGAFCLFLLGYEMKRRKRQ